jgi:hypothetical protein
MKAVFTFNHAAASWQIILMKSGTRANISARQARWMYDRGHPMITEAA